VLSFVSLLPKTLPYVPYNGRLTDRLKKKFLYLVVLYRTRVSNVHLSEQLRCPLFATCVRIFLALYISISLLTVPSHTHSSDPLSEQKLAKGDVVKLHLGAHIDGFAAISAETIVVGATTDSPVTGRRADALRAAWTAAEVAMRLVRVGNKNWQVTEAVSKVAAAWDCKPVEGASFRSVWLQAVESWN
jgi:hypothetical protein